MPQGVQTLVQSSGAAKAFLRGDAIALSAIADSMEAASQTRIAAQLRVLAQWAVRGFQAFRLVYRRAQNRLTVTPVLLVDADQAEDRAPPSFDPAALHSGRAPPRALPAPEELLLVT
jgi:hypothetical protein